MSQPVEKSGMQVVENEPLADGSSSPTVKSKIRPAGLFRLWRAEWFKLRHRRLFWSIILLHLAVILASWAIMVYNARLSTTSVTQVLQSGNALTYVLGLPMMLGRRTGMILMFILGAVFLGSELGSGSLRLVFSRGVRRSFYLAAKCGVLIIACILLVVLGLILSALLINVMVFIYKPAPNLLAIDAHDVVNLGYISLGIAISYLCCALMGVFLAVLTRSSIIASIVGVVYFTIEELATIFLPLLDQHLGTPYARMVSEGLFLPNVNVVYSSMLPPFLARMLTPLDGALACYPAGAHCVPVSFEQAVLVVVTWVLVLLLLSFLIFRKREII